MNFNSNASSVTFFINPVLFLNTKLYTIRVLAMFDFYFRTYTYNLTELENLQNLDSPFRPLACLQTFVWFFRCYLPVRLYRNFALIDEKKLERSLGNGRA